MQSELPKGDSALLAAIKSAKPVPTTKAQADELDDTDTDDAHKPDDCPPVMPPRAKVPHVDLYA